MCSALADVYSSTALSSSPGELSNLRARVEVKREAHSEMEFFVASHSAELQIQMGIVEARDLILVLGRHCLQELVVVEALTGRLVVPLGQKLLAAAHSAERSIVDLGSDPCLQDIVPLGRQTLKSKLEVVLQPRVDDLFRFLARSVEHHMLCCYCSVLADFEMGDVAAAGLVARLHCHPGRW